MNRNDEITLRFFPYMIFAMFVSIMISMLVPIVRIFTMGGMDDIDMYHMNDNLYMMCYFIIYFSVVWIFSCLYHMSNISKWFNYGCIMMIAFIISESASYFMKWIDNLMGDPKIVHVIMYIVRFAPTISIMLMITFIIHGASVLYVQMGKKKDGIFCKKLVVFWVAAFATQILLNIVLKIDDRNEQVSILGMIFTGIVYIYNFVIMIVMYITIKKFCYDYYIYSYNSRLAA